MKIYNIQNIGAKELILFFGGWATDENPFLHLDPNGCDVVMIYDYSDLELSDPKQFNTMIQEYEKVHLAAWSMGVWAAATIYSRYKIPTDNLVSATAINGTLLPIDEVFGISCNIFNKTVDNLPQGLASFNLRMCGSRANYSEYQKIESKRDPIQTKEELIAIKNQQSSIGLDSLRWTKSIIGLNDMIITTGSQQRFWNNYRNSQNTDLEVIEKDFAHYFFNSIKNWLEII